MADNDTEVIKQEMEETRSALAEKLETLGQQVSQTVRETKEAVTDTVQAVTQTVGNTVDTVQETVESVTDSVKNAFDISLQVDRHPWIMMGGAVATGFVVGRLISRGSAASPAPVASSYIPPIGREHNGSHSPPESTGSGNGGQSTGGALLGLLGDQLGQLQGLALGTLFGVIRENLKRSLAPALGHEVSKWVDDLTTKLGGKPLNLTGSRLVEPAPAAATASSAAPAAATTTVGRADKGTRRVETGKQGQGRRGG